MVCQSALATKGNQRFAFSMCCAFPLYKHSVFSGTWSDQNDNAEGNAKKVLKLLNHFVMIESHTTVSTLLFLVLVMVHNKWDVDRI